MFCQFVQFRVGLAALAIVSLVACGGSSDSTTPTTPSPPTPPAPARTMTARIDGAAWSATTVAAGIQNGVLTVTGSNTQPTAIGLTVPAGGTGIFSVGPLSVTQGNCVAPNGTWQANGLGGGTGSGTVTLTSVSTTRVVGTFNFILTPVPFSGAAGNRSITEGAFDVTF